MLEWPIIGPIMFTLNWLTITVPFIVGRIIYLWGVAAEGHTLVNWIAGILAFLGLIAIWVGSYFLIGFPVWVSQFV